MRGRAQSLETLPPTRRRIQANGCASITRGYSDGSKSSVSSVDEIRPPITTVASGRSTSAPAVFQEELDDLAERIRQQPERNGC